jgi:hypothetical protein
MSIGRVGKQAQDSARQHQQRHQISYGPASDAVLQPPQRNRPAAVETTEEAVAIQRAPSFPMTETPVPEMVESSVEDIVQRAENQPEEAAPSENKISPKAVADRVYALLVRDLKREQERLGTFRK